MGHKPSVRKNVLTLRSATAFLSKYRKYLRLAIPKTFLEAPNGTLVRESHPCEISSKQHAGQAAECTVHILDDQFSLVPWLLKCKHEPSAGLMSACTWGKKLRHIEDECRGDGGISDRNCGTLGRVGMPDQSVP